MSRLNDRRIFDNETRMTLIEADADQLELEVVKTNNELEKLRHELRGVKQVLIGILVSLSTASLLLAVNILVKGI